MTIVVVDDSRFNLDLIAAVLEPLGGELVTFEDPLEALAAMERLNPVLLITDQLMPGMEGVELISHVRKLPVAGDVPILMLTNRDDLAVRVAAFDVGVTDFATRPIDPTEMFARARALARLGTAQIELKRHALQLEGRVQVATASLAVQQEEQLLLNRQLRAAEHFEGIAELASGIAHDINNLLTVISGSAEAINSLYPDDPTLVAESEAILNAVSRGASLTRQVLAYSRRQALRPVVFDAAEEIDRHRLMLTHAAGHTATLSMSLPSSPALIFADRTQFLTGLINLVANARDACRRDPRIEVRVGVDLSRGDTGTVLVEVADNGSGMAGDVAERAFDPFFTTKPRGEGTGLGLSMVHGFVHQSGGTVQLSSRIGVGTTVQMMFPRAAGQKVGERPAEVRPAVKRTAMPSVLVVDDDEAVRRTLGRLLELRGMQVRSAPSADAAVPMLDEQRFDAVLSDVLMPGEMDGFDLARQARQRNLPVVLLSGFVGGELPQDLMGDSLVRLLRKPVESATLAREVEALVSGVPAESEPQVN